MIEGLNVRPNEIVANLWNFGFDGKDERFNKGQKKFVIANKLSFQMEKKQDSRHKIQEDSDHELIFETNVG